MMKRILDLIGAAIAFFLARAILRNVRKQKRMLAAQRAVAHGKGWA